MDTKPEPEKPVLSRLISTAKEPVASRVLQFAILVLGLIMLLSVFMPRHWPQVVVGALIISSAVPPLNKFVNRWFAGEAASDEARQIAVIRLLGGVFVTVSGVVQLVIA